MILLSSVGDGEREVVGDEVAGAEAGGKAGAAPDARRLMK